MKSTDAEALLVVALIGVCGAALFFLGSTWDRARGRLRCPRCWYVFQRLDELRCPECGRAVRSRRACGRTRRNWYLSSPGLLLLLYSAWGTGTVLSGTPLWAVPSTVLVLSGVRVGQVPTSDWRGWTHALLRHPGTVLQAELSRRFRDGRLSAWQYRRVLAAGQKLAPSALEGAIWVRARWPRELPLFVHIRSAGIPPPPPGVVRTLVIVPESGLERSAVLSNGGVIDWERIVGFGPLERGWTDSGLSVDWKPTPDGVFRARVMIRDQVPIRGTIRQRDVTVWSTRLERRVTPCDSASDLIAIDNDEATTHMIRESIAVEAVVDEPSRHVALRLQRRGPLPDDLAVAFSLEVEHGQQVIGRAQCRLHKGVGGDLWSSAVYLRGPLTTLRSALESGECRVIVRGDPTLAIRDGDAARCWGGWFTLPLSRPRSK